MRRPTILLVFLLSCYGCSAIPTRYPIQHAEYNRLDSATFTPDEVVLLDKSDPEWSHRLERMADLDPGAEVEVVCVKGNAKTVMIGTVLKSGPQGVALMNCNAFTTIPALSASRILKTTATGAQQFPVKWVSACEIISTRIRKPAPEGYVPPDVEINMKCDVFFTDSNQPQIVQDETSTFERLPIQRDQ